MIIIIIIITIIIIIIIIIIIKNFIENHKCTCLYNHYNSMNNSIPCGLKKNFTGHILKKSDIFYSDSQCITFST